MSKPKTFYAVQFEHDDESFKMTWYVPAEHADNEGEAYDVACNMARDSDVPDWMWRHADSSEVDYHG